MNVLLIGSPGAGKGTYAFRLIKEFDLLHVSTGDLFHQNLKKKTALGLIARKYMDRGELVPDEVADAMVEEWLDAVPPSRGVLFEGFPRTLHQAQFLDEIFQRQRRHLDVVVYLTVSDDVAAERLGGRLVCTGCGTPFHMTFHAPAQADVCDACGGVVQRRADDRPDMVRARLRSFHRSVGPVLEHYQKARCLGLVDTEGAPSGVYREVAAVLRSAQLKELRSATKGEVAHLLTYRPVKLLAEKSARASLDLVLLGGPGSGKGTQAERLCPEFDIPHVSTGDLFRDNLKRATDLGKLAKTYMDRGELVPDSVTEAMVEKRLSHEDAREGFVLDGFPRNLAQAHALDEMLTTAGRRLAGVLFIEVSDDAILDRLSGRRVCSKCQASYHLKFKPPAKAGVCDSCEGTLYQRDDDNPVTIKARLKSFHAQTQPLAEFYNRRGLLVRVSGKGSPAEVTERTITAARSLIPKGAALCSKSPS